MLAKRPWRDYILSMSAANPTRRRRPVASPTREEPMLVASAPKTSRPLIRIKFGSVVITAPRPTEEEIQANVAFSTEALKRAAAVLSKPGVTIPEEKDVPLFHVDEDRPGHFIRRLNGKTERGILEDGVFKVTG